MSCGVGLRCGLGLVLLGPWHRLVAGAPIQPPVRELPYAAGAALRKEKERKAPRQGREATENLLAAVQGGPGGPEQAPDAARGARQGEKASWRR